MENQEVIGLLMFHVVLSCPLSHFASESDKYRAMAVYANNNCDDLSAKKKKKNFIDFWVVFSCHMIHWIFIIYKQM